MKYRMKDLILMDRYIIDMFIETKFNKLDIYYINK
jgi:hypothetical protein